MNPAMMGAFAGSGNVSASSSSSSSPFGRPLAAESSSSSSSPASNLDAATPSFSSSSSSFCSIDALTKNPYFAAGAGLYTLGAAAFVGRYTWVMIQSALKRRFIVSMETTSRDPSYDWLMHWMAKNPTFKFQQISVMTSNVSIQANDETTGTLTFAPSPNTIHWFTHKGWPMIVSRKRQADRAMGSEVLETVEMTTIGRGSGIMQEIVAEARAQAAERDSDRTIIFHNTGNRWSRQQDPRPRRPLQSVMLAGSTREDLLADVKQFLSSRDYYQGLGVPYRRGYLLFGPPGCGKSSLVTALAGELRLAICVLSLSNRSLDDDSLNQLLNTAPQRSIVLLEDIDRAFASDSRITMSGILNALDGVAAQEGRLVFMTTNHVDRLDAALIRPGRADVKVEIGLMISSQIREMFCKFFPPPRWDAKLADEFVKVCPEGRLSPAQLQSHLFLHRDSAEAAVQTMAGYIRSQEKFSAHIRERREKEMLEQQRLQSMAPPRMM